MNRSKRLSVVVEMAVRNEDSAAKTLQRCLEQLALEKNRVTEIEGYYAEYEKQFQQQRSHVSVGTLTNNREFLRKLTETLRAQQDKVKVVEAKLETLKKEWRICHLKSDNLKSYVASIKQQETKVLDAKEQKALDEWSTQFHTRRRD